MTDAPLIDAADVEQAPPPKQGELTAIRDLAAKLYRAERELARLEEDVEKKKKEVEALTGASIPAAMTAVGARRFDLEGGFRVEVEDVVAGSIKKEDRPAAFAWLDEHGHPIVKKVVTVSFGKDEARWAAKFISDIARRKKPLRAEIKESVHDGTLQKFVREMVAKERKGELPDGERLPREIIGVFEAKVARLIDPAEEAKAAAARKSKKPKAEASDDVEM